ncbi:uncharacterized protein LOC124942726 [Impatiens glandulifera]|uniref:uncharacterized protein LOC124942726 n=1 Tax=Impatiens glandulifera TaxID=253017 RepID=UPI001FB126E5|nr:uncharacterized protein LOC124942726 [Impatiens glandulifera]
MIVFKYDCQFSTPLHTLHLHKLAMKSVLLRTGSVPIFHHHHSPSPVSPRVSLSLQSTEINRRSIIRSSSDSDMIRSQINGLPRPASLGSMFVPAGIPEDETNSFEDEVSISVIGSLSTLDKLCLNRSMSENPVEEVSFGGGGGDDEWRFTGTFTGGNSDRSKIGEYYQEMLKTDPMNPLLLRNYGKFLHEVEGNMKKAGEYYERAIVANPGDGEVLSMYAKLIWQFERDEDRSKLYFDQAVLASPDDCMVLGSYAHFMWEADEEDDDEEIEMGEGSKNSMVVVKAF